METERPHAVSPVVKMHCADGTGLMKRFVFTHTIFSAHLRLHFHKQQNSFSETIPNLPCSEMWHTHDTIEEQDHTYFYAFIHTVFKTALHFKLQIQQTHAYSTCQTIQSPAAESWTISGNRFQDIGFSLTSGVSQRLL